MIEVLMLVVLVIVVGSWGYREHVEKQAFKRRLSALNFQEAELEGLAVEGGESCGY